MGIRQALNENPKLAVVAVVVIIGIAVFMITFSMPKPPAPESAKVFYTADDGATYFVDSVTLHPPFERNGRQVVRAFVFACEGSPEPKVGYMMMYSPEGRAKLIEADAKADGDYTDALDGMPPQHILFKKPGDANWVHSGDPRIRQIKTPNCPEGQAVRAVLPTQ
ncbi:hypothetical protein QQ054_04530 [Oscillatoria amoena NRMC-F 0135]|nr:hypothetical protein [Oscillatoria amoena NRMC-F 0135]